MEAKKQRSWRPRKLLLVFASMRAEIQEVKKAHKKVCVTCGKVPTVLRLLIQKGAGRSAKTYVYCRKHGYSYLESLLVEVNRAGDVLAGRLPETECVRIHPDNYPAIKFLPVKKKKALKSKP